MPDITIVISAATRMAAIRDGLHLSGRALRFTERTLAAALASIRLHEPKLVAVDALFARTPEGHAFLERVDELGILASVRLITHNHGGWSTTPHAARPISAETQTVAATPLIARPVTLGAAPFTTHPAVVPPSGGANTRRAPRFRVLDPLKAVVERGHASLVNISVLGAQVVSGPILRPNQTVKISLPDTDTVLRVTAHVAWSMLEQPREGTDLYYRAGVEFTDAAKQTLEEYCRRHCGDNPLPSF